MSVCDGCQYYPACGEKDRTEPCNGKAAIPHDAEVVFYDYFRGVLCLEKDGFAPPERYAEIFRGDDVYIETYDVGDSRRMSFSFTKEEVEKGLASCKREAAMRENGYTNYYMVSMTVPSDEFDRMIGWKMEEEEDAEDKD